MQPEVSCNRYQHLIYKMHLPFKCSIWEDHRFTRAREPVNKMLSVRKGVKSEPGMSQIYDRLPKRIL